MDALEKRWSALRSEHGPRALRRVEGFLDVLRGRRRAPAAPRGREYYSRLYFPGLPARPWHDPSAIPWTRALRDASRGIAADFARLVEDGGPFVPYRYGYRPARALTEPGHTAGRLRGEWWAYFLRSAYRPVEDALARFPATRRALEKTPVAREALFSLLPPGAGIAPHSDKANFIVTAHLGIRVPDRCGLRVGGRTRAWVENECLVFDGTYLHEAWNDSRSTRAVLIVDAWHPALTRVEIAALESLWPSVERRLGLRPRV
jgi:hypothetical protein